MCNIVSVRICLCGVVRMRACGVMCSMSGAAHHPQQVEGGRVEKEKEKEKR